MLPWLLTSPPVLGPCSQLRMAGSRRSRILPRLIAPKSQDSWRCWPKAEECTQPPPTDLVQAPIPAAAEAPPES